MTLPAGTLMMSSCHTHSSGSCLFCPSSKPRDRRILQPRARRNTRGDLEPDAPEDVVQNSLGFGGYELAPKKVSSSDKSSQT